MVVYPRSLLDWTSAAIFSLETVCLEILDLTSSPTLTPNSGSPPAPLQLILMRHAKSDWSGDDTSDHDRPLNDRGIRDAPTIARWLAESQFLPDLILCSSAKRTQQTAALMNSYWKNTGLEQPRIIISTDLYLSSHETIAGSVQQHAACDSAAPKHLPQTVLVLAHNPGISHAASVLAGHPIGLPTAALVAFRSARADWSAPLTRESMQCVAELSPKMLARQSR